MWALRDEVARGRRPGAAARRRAGAAPAPGGPARLSAATPSRTTPLFRGFSARALDGHPTPATPFVKLATGASGVGCRQLDRARPSARADRYGDDAPRVHIVEGEGGLTPAAWPRRWPRPAPPPSATSSCTSTGTRRPSTPTASAARASLPGDYVQWDPRELFYLHDWNVVDVPDGHDFQQVVAAQRPRAGARQRPADGDRLPHAQGLAVRRRGQGHATAPATSSAPRASIEAVAELSRHRRRRRAADLRARRPRAATGRTARRCARSASGRRCRSCAPRSTQRPADGGRAGASGSRRVPRPARRRATAAPRPAPRASTTSTSSPPRRRRSHPDRGDAEELRLEPGTFTTLRGELGRALQLPASGLRRGVPRRRRRPRSARPA